MLFLPHNVLCRAMCINEKKLLVFKCQLIKNSSNGLL